jgi:hypothetical protein
MVLVMFNLKAPFAKYEAAFFGLVLLLTYTFTSFLTSEMFYVEIEDDDIFLAHRLIPSGACHKLGPVCVKSQMQKRLAICNYEGCQQELDPTYC